MAAAVAQNTGDGAIGDGIVPKGLVERKIAAPKRYQCVSHDARAPTNDHFLKRHSFKPFRSDSSRPHNCLKLPRRLKQGRISMSAHNLPSSEPKLSGAERALVLSEAIKLLEDERRGFSDRLFMNNVQTESLPPCAPSGTPRLRPRPPRSRSPTGKTRPSQSRIEPLRCTSPKSRPRSWLA